MLMVDSKAPDFNLNGLDAEGKESLYSLKDIIHPGKKTVLYFYPKDDTPGCTKEACDFRDNFNRLTSKAVVVGVSADSIASHEKFREKQGINFILLSDPSHEMLINYGVWQKKSMMGKSYMGIVRTTFIIDENGIINKIWDSVDVKGHVDDVLNSI